ncbi:MAG: hypothetical protein NTY77_05525 [Elusimicrobia bacterium]|nr:hypothetical protein [Elusimicrobiota bacterium]
MTAPKEIQDKIEELGGPGSGWSLVCSVEGKHRPPWSLARKQSYRRRRLELRMKQKFPLLAAELVTSEIAARPGYFGTVR